MAESRDETTLVTPLEEVGSRAERTFVFWLTNGSHAVNHFQNQMLVLLYAVIAADLGFGIVTVGVLVTIRGVLSSAAQGLYGFATPFLPRAWLLGIGNLVLGLGTVLTGFTTSFATLLGARSVANVGSVMFGIKGIEAVQFGSGVMGVEAPVDGGLGGVALSNQSLDLPPESFLVGEPLSEAGTGQYAELDFRHPFDKLRTGFNQLPCLGV